MNMINMMNIVSEKINIINCSFSQQRNTQNIIKIIKRKLMEKFAISQDINKQLKKITIFFIDFPIIIHIIFHCQLNFHFGNEIQKSLQANHRISLFSFYYYIFHGTNSKRWQPEECPQGIEQ